MERYHHYQTVEDQFWCNNCNIYPHNVLLGANVQSIHINCIKIVKKLFLAQEIPKSISNQEIHCVQSIHIHIVFLAFKLCLEHSNSLCLVATYFYLFIILSQLSLSLSLLLLMGGCFILFQWVFILFPLVVKL